MYSKFEYMKSLYVILFILIFSGSVINLSIAQITVINPSFEDTPADATTPHGWHKCNESTTPDILPGFWGVYTESAQGNTYIGMITRSDGSYETIGQRLSKTCKKQECYVASIELAHSKTYTGFNKAIKLQIYLGDSKCNTEQLIFESPIIKHVNWKKYPIKFTPKENYDYIIIRAYHPRNGKPIKSNILIDNFSSIEICPKV